LAALKKVGPVGSWLEGPFDQAAVNLKRIFFSTLAFLLEFLLLLDLSI
jgi:hypothetical protein